MLGLIKEGDRLLKTIDAVLWPTQKPVRPRHIGVKLAEHERGRIAANDIYSGLKMLDCFFAVSFLMQTVGDLTIRLGHTEPVAIRAKIVERTLGKVTRDRVLAELSVNARQSDVNRTGERGKFVALDALQIVLE